MDIYRSFQKKKNLDIDGLSTAEVFSKIYKDNYWGSEESISGSGSDTIQTNVIIKELEKLFQDYQIKTLLDAPCGDFNWMNQVRLDGLEYLGMDIVEELIQKNQSKYQDRPNVIFQTGNILTDSLPSVDLILCRDCLVHFSLEDIHRALDNFKKSGAKYLLTTSFIKHQENPNIQTGYWRPINLQAAPFHLPEPILSIDEKCTEGGGKHRDKSLVLYEIQSI
ncbi:class I SAM-dependent methyltransferase [Algoriphagus hitonicola]|nr:class I SAM-dependent methyltransferase [Algoriphagus hitonicola]